MKPKTKILVIEDEMPIRRFLAAGLTGDEFALIEAENGQLGLQRAATDSPDLILLDLGLPDIDGVELTKRLREWYSRPILVLSARGNENDKILALDSGANDYLTKPFGIGELLARIRVSLRTYGSRAGEPEVVFTSGRLRVDLSARRVFVSNSEIHLTPIEYKLLTTFIRNRGKVLTHRSLLTEVWGAAYARETQYLRVFMKQLRQKIEQDPAQPEHFLTEPGIGYRFVEL